MNKNFIFRIGPFEAAEEPTYSYYVYPGQDNDFLFLADKDEEGFEKILEIYSPNELECEPELGEVAAHYGIPVGGMTLERLHTIALMGLEAIEEQHFKDILHEGLIYQFGGAAADFWRAMPWNKAFAKLHLQFHFEGSINLTLYGLVMGESGREYGIALYKTPEDLRKMLDLASESLLEEAATIDTLGVIFSDEPKYAAHAMQRTHNIDKIPIPVTVQGGRRYLVTDLDLLALAAALEALSVMDDTMDFALGRVSVEDLRTVCRITPEVVPT